MMSYVTVFLSLSVAMTALTSTSVSASKLSSAELEDLQHWNPRETQLAGKFPQAQSSHMKLADRLLQKVLDLTYETLQEIGASEEDLNNVRRKRNYIQSCYFHAISCF